MKSIYNLSQNPSILYTSTALLKYFSQKPGYAPLLWDLLLDLTQTTLKVHVDGVGQSEMVGEYSNLMEYAMRDFAGQVKSVGGLVDGVLAWGGAALVQLAGLSRQDRCQREAFYSVCRMLNAMLKDDVDSSHVGANLVRALITCLAQCGSSLSRASSLCDVLRRLRRHPSFAVWIAASELVALPPGVPAAAKSRFLAALMAAPIGSVNNTTTTTGGGAAGNGKTKGGKGGGGEGGANGHVDPEDDKKERELEEMLDRAFSNQPEVVAKLKEAIQINAHQLQLQQGGGEKKWGSRMTRV